MARKTYVGYWKSFFQTHTTEILEFLRAANSPDEKEIHLQLQTDFKKALERYTYSTSKVKEWKKEIGNLDAAVLMFQSAKDEFESSLISSITQCKYILGIK